MRGREPVQSGAFSGDGESVSAHVPIPGSETRRLLGERETLFTFVQGALGFDPVTYVLHHGREVLRSARGIAHQGRVKPGPYGRAIFADVALFHRWRGGLAGEQAPNKRYGRLPIFGMCDIEKVSCSN